MSSRTFVTVALTALFLGSVSGCTKNEPPKPDPSAAAPSNSAASTRPKLNVRSPMGPMARIDPQAMKDYRIDVCYYGTLSLRQARDSYLASLGKSQPSEKKIPNFGAPAPDAAKPAAPDAVKPAAAPAPKASASGAPPSTPPSPAVPPRPFDFALRAPHERNARACTASMALKDPAMPGVDEALAVYGPYSVELAKDIATATSYYQREEYKKDSFAKGTELHKKLLEEFGALDDQQDKLGAAIDTYRKAHPVDPTKVDEGEKITADTFEDARQVVMVLAAKKVDSAAYKANVDKLDKAVEALKTFSAAHASDTWSKIMAAPFEAFTHAAKDAKVTDKGVPAEDFLNLVTNFTGLIEARQRGLQRSMITKGQVTVINPPPAMAPAAASGAPAAAPPQP